MDLKSQQDRSAPIPGNFSPNEMLARYMTMTTIFTVRDAVQEHLLLMDTLTVADDDRDFFLHKITANLMIFFLRF
jgi:hypothetical protein